MPKIAEALSELEAEISTLEERYIKKFLPAKPEDKPEDFSHDVKAFCLMVHAACEEFVEFVSGSIVSQIEKEFLQKKITLSTISLIMSYAESIGIDNDDKSQDSCFDFVRKGIDSAKKKHANTLKDNHGFSIRYLKKLLTPIGINLPSGPKVDSLKILADARGSFAHTRAQDAMYGEYGKAHKVLAPEEARQVAEDCLDLCREMVDRTEKIW